MMNIQETDDPIKSQLLNKVTHQQEELKHEVQEITERTQKIFTNALIIGGGLALTYLLIRGFSDSKKRKSKKKASAKQTEARIDADEEYETPSLASTVLSRVGTAVATQATVLLLDLAREKLAEYLQAQAQKKTDEPS
jgi:FtsZ-interacting cell division protein ZipA